MTTAQQLQTLKTDIAANANTIPAGQPWSGSFAGTAVKDVPNNGDGNAAIAGWYNQLTAAFWVFRSDVGVDEIFDQVTWANYTPADAPDATVQWSNRSLACQGKQFNLQILLQGRNTFNAGRITLRAGLNDCTTNLPSGVSGASRSGGWSTILTILRRLARNTEQLFAAATTGVGTGVGGLGATGNPGLMGFEGVINGDDVQNARNLP